MKPEIEVIHTNKDNLIDYMWLFNHIPWSNHENKIGKVILEEPTKAYGIIMDGFDTSTTEITEFEFDNVIITAVHGSGGNSFGFEFKLSDETVFTLNDYHRFHFTKEDVKKRFTERLEQKIKGLNWQISTTESAIDRIKSL